MAGLNQSFGLRERERATAWKLSSQSLPERARESAKYLLGGRAKPSAPEYGFCLPLEFASLSLLPEVRESALKLFADLGIPWHMGVEGGPSNHLLSSQVQCVNALGQMVSDPKRIIQAFGGLLGSSEVYEIEEGRYLTFEFIGDRDYFNESKSGKRTRGSQCTSVDSAFLHRTSQGVKELVLIEWKYVESYSAKPRNMAKLEIRRSRYESALKREDSPVRSDLLAFEDLLDEPIYQLMRQQLLARELERERAYDADVVRILHVHPVANQAYDQSIHRPSQRALGSNVGEVWASLLRCPDRYMTVDNSHFLDPGITSNEYLARYGS